MIHLLVLLFILIGLMLIYNSYNNRKLLNKNKNNNKNYNKKQTRKNLITDLMNNCSLVEGLKSKVNKSKLTALDKELGYKKDSGSSNSVLEKRMDSLEKRMDSIRYNSTKALNMATENKHEIEKGKDKIKDSHYKMKRANKKFKKYDDLNE